MRTIIRGHRRMRGAFPGVVLAIVLAGLPAVAQDKVNLDTFVPSIHPGDVLDVLTANMPQHLGWSAGAWITGNGRPLRLVDGADNVIYDVVKYQVVGEIYASLGLWEHLDIALAVPLFFVSAGDAPPAGLGVEQAGGFSLGDLRLGLKGTILGGNGKGFGLALAEDLTFPTSTKHNFTGSENVTGLTRLILDYSESGWQIAFNLGILAKQKAYIVNIEYASELQMALGAVFPLICGKLEGLATVTTRTALARPFKEKYERALDLMGGLRLNLGNLTLAAAAGAGALGGFGSPAWRATLNIGYAPELDKGCTADRDHDGICDADDACPDEPGPAATNGCPDRDGDGIPDKDDACPDAPGLLAFAGCPDMDGDGIPDKDDLCPAEPGTKANHGCPDRDGDGILDKDDACPDQKGPAATKGCPDRDGDGVPDKDDKCPDVYGKAEFQGCPPPTPKSIRLTAEKIEILEIVYFDTGKATIQERSNALLQDIATVMKDNPNLKKVRIEGHTDNVGQPARNLGLSQSRAEAVRKFLIEKGGVAADRLAAEGLGDTHPVADNKTADGRAKNRRVEFVIVEGK